MTHIAVLVDGEGADLCRNHLDDVSHYNCGRDFLEKNEAKRGVADANNWVFRIVLKAVRRQAGKAKLLEIARIDGAETLNHLLVFKVVPITLAVARAAVAKENSSLSYSVPVEVLENEYILRGAFGPLGDHFVEDGIFGGATDLARGLAVDTLGAAGLASGAWLLAVASDLLGTAQQAARLEPGLGTE